MAARTVKIRHDEEGRFYVYRLVAARGLVLYIGKGSGRRLRGQQAKYKCSGEIISRFKRERDAYAFEVKAIAEYQPALNKHKGGNGSRAMPLRTPRKSKWELELDRVGSRRYAARMLLRFDTRGYIDQSKLELIRQVANGPRR